MMGLWRIEHMALSTAIGVGSVENKEFTDVISTPDILRPLVQKTQGSLHRLAKENSSDLNFPPIRRMNAEYVRKDDTSIQLISQAPSRLMGIRLDPLIVGLLGLLTLFLPLIAMWILESGWFRSPQQIRLRSQPGPRTEEHKRPQHR
jgi:hypothetical protein